MDFDNYYKTDDNILKYPFFCITIYYKIFAQNLKSNENKAINNLNQFLISLSIICRRIKKNLLKYKPHDISKVDYNELFIDVQSFFLFLKQFLEDTILVFRLSVEKKLRHGMSPRFSVFLKKYNEYIPENDLLKVFLDKEADFFHEITDIRDDISHRTDYSKKRSKKFPDIINVYLSGISKKEFISNMDLKSYISFCLKKILTYSNLMTHHILIKLRKEKPDYPLLKLEEGYVYSSKLKDKKLNFNIKSKHSKAIRFIEQKNYNGLLYFL